jgi:hypothetical protein
MTATATRTRPLWPVLVALPPAAIAVLRLILPYDTTDDAATVMSKVAANQDTQNLVVWLGFLAVLTMVPAVLLVASRVRRAAPRLTAAAVILLVPAYLALGLLVAGDAGVLFGVREGLDPAVTARMFTELHPVIAVAEIVFVVGHVVGTVLLGIAMWKVVPRWVAIATIMSQPLHFVAAVVLANHELDLVAWMLNAVGFAIAALINYERNSGSAL